MEGDGGVVGQGGDSIGSVEGFYHQSNGKYRGGDGEQCRCQHGSKKPRIILAADAGVEPYTMVVETHHTFVAISTVFAGHTHIDFTEITVHTILTRRG